MVEIPQFSLNTSTTFTHALRIFLKLDQFLKFVWKNKYVWLARKTLQNNECLQDYLLKCIIKAIVIKVERHRLSNRAELKQTQGTIGIEYTVNLRFCRDFVHGIFQIGDYMYFFIITGSSSKNICNPTLFT